MSQATEFALLCAAVIIPSVGLVALIAWLVL